MNRHLSERHPGRSFDAIKSRRRAQEHKDLVFSVLQRGRSNDNRVAPILETVAEEIHERTADTEEYEPDGNDGGTVVVGGCLESISQDPGALACRRAVEWLSTVPGHGAKKLLTAAKLLAEENQDPTDTITTWYREYMKDSCKESKVKPGARNPQNPRNRVPARERIRPLNNRPSCTSVPKNKSQRKALNAKAYRQNTIEWMKDPKRVVDRVLFGIDASALQPGFDEMQKYWVPILSGNVDSQNPGLTLLDPESIEGRVRHCIFEPITVEEVVKCLPSHKVAPGPDGFPARLW